MVLHHHETYACMHVSPAWRHRRAARLAQTSGARSRTRFVAIEAAATSLSSKQPSTARRKSGGRSKNSVGSICTEPPPGKLVNVRPSSTRWESIPYQWIGFLIFPMPGFWGNGVFPHSHTSLPVVVLPARYHRHPTCAYRPASCQWRPCPVPMPCRGAQAALTGPRGSLYYLKRAHAVWNPSFC